MAMMEIMLKTHQIIRTDGAGGGGAMGREVLPNPESEPLPTEHGFSYSIDLPSNQLLYQRTRIFQPQSKVLSMRFQ